MSLEQPSSEAPMATVAVAARCVNHDEVARAATCEACARPICEVCSFRFGPRAWCGDCMTAGPDAGLRTSATRHAILSLVLTLLGFLILIGVFVAAAGGGVSDGVDRAVGVVWTALAIAGLGVGVASRDGAGGSVLPNVAVVAASLLVALQFFFILRGLFG